MTFKAKLIGALVVAGLLVALGWAVNNAITYKEQRDKAKGDLLLANDTISDMKVRQRDVAALDAKYYGELADAKATIGQLERDVAAGRKRLQLNATCRTNGTPGSTSVDDGASPRLTDAAERDYFTLRERIETITSQLAGIQQYVREQCLR